MFIPHSSTVYVHPAVLVVFPSSSIRTRPQLAVISTPHFRIFAFETMRPQLVHICAVVVVHLVAVAFHLVTVGAHDVSPNVITKSASALQLGQGTRHLRTRRSTQDSEEERGYEIAAEFSTLVEEYKNVMEIPSDAPLHEVVKKALESGYFTGLLKKFYNRGMQVDDVYRTTEYYDKEVRAGFEKAYMEYVNEMNSRIYPTLPEHVSIRSKDKGPAEIAGVQLTPKETSDQDQYAVWLQHGVHPTDVLKLLKLDEAGETFLGDLRMFTWMIYLNEFNEMHPKNPTTVIDALKKGGIEEETLVNMVFSWDLRRKSIVEQVEEYMHFPSDKSRKKMEKTLLKSQEKVRTRILNELTNSWLVGNYDLEQALDAFGLSPTLPLTGFDFSRITEWMNKFASNWVKRNGQRFNKFKVFPVLWRRYDWEGLEQLKNQAKGKSSKNLASMLAQWIETKKEDIEAASTSSTQKRKRDT
ncbi:hypothetical protein KXD40_005145 [Peronospora effusa]|nr:hypothetical protein KXD40_005145 [Peronospora effusa]